MNLSILDIIIIIIFLSISLYIGLYYRKSGSKDLTSFFLGGKNLPWYIVGISMVATTFAADTPLAVVEMVADNGISKNWLWWSFLIGGMLTTFFFSHLWKRANITTELEFINIRYSGKQAYWLRLCKAIYLGVFMNSLIMAWVNLAFTTILSQFFNLSFFNALVLTSITMILAVVYTSISGLKGVIITDTVQFFIAIAGTIILAILVLDSDTVGGIENLKKSLPKEYFNFFPSIAIQKDNTSIGVFSTLSLSFGAFLSFVAIQWWASWYPGAEPGGGGYIAQRMMSTKSEKDSLYATLLFQIAHYCIRPWPWIIVGLAAVYLYSPEFQIQDKQLVQKIYELKNQNIQLKNINKYIPEYESNDKIKRAIDYTYNARLGYVYTMVDFLPNGLRGLLIVAFLAAYLSTISTQLNWGASYIVNDFYLPLTSNTKNVILISRISTIFLMITGIISTTLIDSISGVWEWLMECGAGLGLVLILRWYWWRINAWSEIAAILAPFVGYVIGRYILNPYFGEWFVIQKGSYIFTVLFTTASWLIVTYITKPTKYEIISSFYKRVKPQGWWPKELLISHGENKNIKKLFFSWFSAIIMTYSILFAIGKFIFLEYTSAIIYSVIAIFALVILRYSMKDEKHV